MNGPEPCGNCGQLHPFVACPHSPQPLKRIGGEPITFEVPEIDMEKIAEEMRQSERNRLERERTGERDRRARALADISALPIEERLARIEAWIYDYRPEYVPPPRFR